MTKKPLSRAIYIVAAKRTPFGTFGGTLKQHTATDLGVVAAKAALEAGGIDPKIIDAVCVGNVAQTSADAIYMARHVGLRAGVPIEVPALTINRLCGSGFQSVVNGAQDILTGEADIVLTGGTENMSQAPH
ncbi:MAG: acetyl-CoA C-acyltransferase, partial [Myxococcales bacterium]|nr:acetyl-CoA C-acyltransferase [Myxococcales bacterium]